MNSTQTSDAALLGGMAGDNRLSRTLPDLHQLRGKSPGSNECDGDFKHSSLTKRAKRRRLLLFPVTYEGSRQDCLDGEDRRD